MILTVKGYKVHLVDDDFNKRERLSNRIYINKHTLVRQSCFNVDCPECPFGVGNPRTGLGCTLEGSKFDPILTKDILNTTPILKPRNIK